MPPGQSSGVRDELASLLARWSADCDRVLVVGLCGAQGSGKSTLAQALGVQLAARGIATVVLALDDFYLTRSERRRLAAEVHPLLATRGVPGTHDVALLSHTLAAIGAGRASVVPVFDKAIDDRASDAKWRHITPPARLVLVEGWCVGARPQPEAELGLPVNDLERLDDARGTWRSYVNEQLAGPYRQFHARLDRLVLLAVPGMDAVYEWRRQQERALVAARAASGSSASHVMDEAQLHRFIAHYERLTRHMLAEMPAYADAVIDVLPGHELAWRSGHGPAGT
jgi:D-glycerate 3-kinase